MFNDETKFSKSEKIHGGWTYLGPSVLEGERIVDLKTLDKVLQKPKRSLKYKVLKEVEAKEMRKRVNVCLVAPRNRGASCFQKMQNLGNENWNAHK